VPYPRPGEQTEIKVQRFTLEIPTEGNCDIINLSPAILEHIKPLRGDGVVHLFVVGSTAALTTLEYEPGLVKHDFCAALQRLLPDNVPYDHEATWNDDNGHAHLRSSFIGPSLTIPFSNGTLLTGEYQQIILADFDTRPRRRKIIGTIIL
jgi:secondary thiamine-phosphate synthase enzyme